MLTGISAFLLAVLWLPSFALALVDPALNHLFYPFGFDVGDDVIPPNDDGSTDAVPIDIGFPFFNSSNTKLYVNTNGAISFGNSVTSFTPTAFPVPNRMIAPFWCDIDTTKNNGRIYYRQSKDNDLLVRATKDVKTSFSHGGLSFFQAKWIFIATWHDVTYYGGNEFTPVNSFQAVLITDGKYSMAMFNYGQITWTTGTSSGGNNVTGLGGTAAQVGFNAGDDINYFVVPGSRTSSIVDIADNTNARLKGRWMFRIESSKIESSNLCMNNEKCEAYQTFDKIMQQCLDKAPAFQCPRLEGPVVIKRVWIEFYCIIETDVTSPNALFNVTFLFNGEQDHRVPSFILRPPERKATLHEKHLTHKQLGKWISCQVTSRWVNSAEQSRVSRPITSQNRYFAGIQASSHIVTVQEGDINPATITLKSTLPITCHREQDTTCGLILRIRSEKEVLFKQKDGSTCHHIIEQDDWKEEEKKAYKDGAALELYARIDTVVSRSRFKLLTIEVEALPRKVTEDGKETYTNMWSKHRIEDILVYHADIPYGVCRATGDPNLTTLDGFFYSVYASGQFTYIQTTHGPPLEIQVWHKTCGQAVSCACGVAAREGDLILVAEKCTDSYVHTFTFSRPDEVPEGAEITKDSTGRKVEIHLPSKVKVTAYITSWGMNIEIYITPAEFNRTEGLCGSLDNNVANDLKVRGHSKPTTVQNVAKVVTSWRVSKHFSLFNGNMSKLPHGPKASSDHNTHSFCNCKGVSKGECGSTKFDISFSDTSSDKHKNKNKNKKEDNDALKFLPTENVIRQMRRKRQASESRSHPTYLMTDNIDWNYNETSYQHVHETPELPRNNTWPTRSGLTEAEVRSHCRRVLWEELPIRRTCEGWASNSSIDGVVEKCVCDVKMTDDLSWAQDKIAEVLSLCIWETRTANITERNVTIEEISASVEQLSSLVCLTPNCSGHGQCQNGSCVCYKGYIGLDCSLKEDAVPKIKGILSPQSCDSDKFLCQKVDFLTEDVASATTLTCKVEVTQPESKSTTSFITSGSFESLYTASCQLPTENYLEGLRRLQRHARTNGSSGTMDENDLGFYSLPHGSPVLYYAVSMSNGGNRFSIAQRLNVYQSKCYECDTLSCKRKNSSCEIRRICFQKGDRNPYNPECDFCNPEISENSWTKESDESCDPCRSSPCNHNAVCVSPRKGDFRCVHPYSSDKSTITLAVYLSLMAVILVVFIVIIVSGCRKRKAI